MSMTLGIPKDLALRARSAAITHGTSVTALVTGWLERWLTGQPLEDEPSGVIHVTPELYERAAQVLPHVPDAPGTLDGMIAVVFSGMIGRYGALTEPQDPATPEGTDHEQDQAPDDH